MNHSRLTYHGHKVIISKQKSEASGTERGRLESLEAQPLPPSVLCAEQLIEHTKWEAGDAEQTLLVQSTLITLIG